jgi:hypothetical protein
MGRILLWFAMAGVLSAQTITEVGAAAAGGATGGAAGKKVSGGITKIFGNIDKQTAEAAKTSPETETKPETAKTAAATAATAASSATAGPSNVPAPPRAPKVLLKRPEKSADETAAKIDRSIERPTEKSDYNSLVPPPPPIQHAAVRRPEPKPVEPPPAPEPPPPPAVIPPPPPVTADDLRAVTAGVNREDVLKIGQPASRITMFDDGHLSEIFRYGTGNSMLGIVHLSDGVVTSVDLR